MIIKDDNHDDGAMAPMMAATTELIQLN